MINLDGYSLGQLQDIRSLLTMAEAEGLTDIRFARQRIEEHIRRATVTARAKYGRYRSSGGRGKPGRERLTGRGVCSVCGAEARVERVNVCPSTAVGGLWKTALSCTDHACLHVELSELTVAEVV